MKKTVFVLSIAMLAGLFVACNKENPVEEKTPLTVGATIQDADATKLAYNKSTSAITWESGDVIRLYAPKKEELRTEYLNTFTVNTISAGGKTANFREAVAHDWSDAGEVVAFYGKSTQVKVWTGGAGGSLYYPAINFPRQQVYNSTNNPDKELLFMISQKVTITGTDYTPLKDLHFTPYASVVKIPVKDSGNSGKTLSSIKLSVTGTAIAGRHIGFTVYAPSYAPMQQTTGLVWVASEATDVPANKIVTLTEINTVMNSTVKDYYVVVAPQANHYPQGILTVTLTSTSGDTKEFTYSENNWASQAGYVHNFPVVDWGSN